MSKSSGRPIRYEDDFHRSLRERVRKYRQGHREEYEQQLEAARMTTVLNKRPAKSRWSLYDIIDIATGSIVGATVRRSIESPKRHYVPSKWMPLGVHDYQAAKAIVALRRLQIERWQAAEMTSVRSTRLG